MLVVAGLGSHGGRRWGTHHIPLDGSSASAEGVDHSRSFSLRLKTRHW